MGGLAILAAVVIGAVGAWYHRRRDHEPRMHLLGRRIHGPDCGCEACLENYAPHVPARLASTPCGCPRCAMGAMR